MGGGCVFDGWALGVNQPPPRLKPLTALGVLVQTLDRFKRWRFN